MAQWSKKQNRQFIFNGDYANATFSVRCKKIITALITQLITALTLLISSANMTMKFIPFDDGE